MPNDYSGIKQVREHNGQNFIDDFRSVNDIVVYPYATQRSFRVLKQDVWDRAKTGKLHYVMTTEVFVNGRMVMQIL